MPKTTIASDIHQPLDVHADFTAKIAFHQHLFFDDVTQALHFVIREVANARVTTDGRLSRSRWLVVSPIP